MADHAIATVADPATGSPEPPSPAPPSPGAGIRFRGRFRRYQQSMLDLVAGHPPSDLRYHLVAPPGSGKTILGLELIGRLDRPALVFAPTTTIQHQWLDELRLFTDEPRRIAGRDPADLRAVNVFTYQLISTPDRAGDELRSLAIDTWIEELIEAGTSDSAEAASARIERMAEANPAAHRRELAKRTTRERRRLLEADSGVVYEHLHRNARDLIDRLVAAGIGTVVLDECHHLLDYWAIVLRALIGRLDRPHVIGLTATLPSLDDADEYENYTSLLGDVDFEIPTPAVIKEGDLAPFRDLAWWVTPTDSERAWLRAAGDHFEAAIADLTSSPAFALWLAELLEPPMPSEGPPLTPSAADRAWGDWAMDHYELASAVVQVAAQRGLTLGPSAQALLGDRAAEGPGLDAWLVLIERYGLDRLKLSEDPDDHARLRALRRVIAPFGMTLTERGLRQGRSIVDIVLSFSESKALATVDIIEREAARLGPMLRAVVVTDFERQSSGVRRTKGLLDREAGSAVRVFRTLAMDERTAPLHPVLLTGSAVRTTVDFAPELATGLGDQARGRGIDLSVHIVERDGVAELEADGPAWRPGIYVDLVTAIFETGRTQLLVGTRGLLGEGWDAPSANTLVDLTSVTTATSVQQLRGRILRLDPAWPTKTAHAYDVVCIEPSLELGGIEFERLARRHGRKWGIVPPGSKHAGDIVRGLDHVDPALVAQMWRDYLLELQRTVLTLGLSRPREPWQLIDTAAANARTAAAVEERDHVRRLWRIGEPYENTSEWFSRLRPRTGQHRTVAWVSDTLKALIVRLSLIPALTSLAFALAARTGSAELTVGATLVTFLVTTALSARSIVALVRSLLVEQPPDAIVGDAARALLAALRRTGKVSGWLVNESLVVEPLPDGTVMVRMRSHRATEDSDTFSHALDELFGPVRSPRYLIRRDDGRLPNLALQAVWGPVRTMLRESGRQRPVYHAVPTVLGSRRQDAQVLADEWRRWVGGGQLVHARSKEGQMVLAAARADRRPVAERLLTERWR